MNAGDIESAKLELALAGRDQKRLADWALKWGEELVREIEDADSAPDEMDFF